MTLRLTRPRKPRPLPPPLEAEEQKSFVKWFETQYPSVRILAIPNGAFLFGDGVQRAKQMARLKEQGLKKGVLDLLVPAWFLWIEMKRCKGGKLSPEQADWIMYLRDSGYTVIVCAGAQAAIDAVKAFARSAAA
jgi:hypothetical protein